MPASRAGQPASQRLVPHMDEPFDPVDGVIPAHWPERERQNITEARRILGIRPGIKRAGPEREQRVRSLYRRVPRWLELVEKAHPASHPIPRPRDLQKVREGAAVLTIAAAVRAARAIEEGDDGTAMRFRRLAADALTGAHAASAEISRTGARRRTEPHLGQDAAARIANALANAARALLLTADSYLGARAVTHQDKPFDPVAGVIPPHWPDCERDQIAEARRILGVGPECKRANPERERGVRTLYGSAHEWLQLALETRPGAEALAAQVPWLVLAADSMRRMEDPGETLVSGAVLTIAAAVGAAQAQDDGDDDCAACYRRLASDTQIGARAASAEKSRAGAAGQTKERPKDAAAARNKKDVLDEAQKMIRSRVAPHEIVGKLAQPDSSLRRKGVALGENRIRKILSGAGIVGRKRAECQTKRQAAADKAAAEQAHIHWLRSEISRTVHVYEEILKAQGKERLHPEELANLLTLLEEQQAKANPQALSQAHIINAYDALIAARGKTKQ